MHIFEKRLLTSSHRNAYISKMSFLICLHIQMPILVFEKRHFYIIYNANYVNFESTNPRFTYNCNIGVNQSVEIKKVY
jgi:hypothetical protein